MSFSVIVCFGFGNGLFWVYCALCGQCLHLLFSKVTILRVSRQLSSQGQHVIMNSRRIQTPLPRSPLPGSLHTIPHLRNPPSTVESILCHVFFRGCALSFPLLYLDRSLNFTASPAWMAWDDVLFIQSATLLIQVLSPWALELPQPLSSSYTSCTLSKTTYVWFLESFF